MKKLFTVFCVVFILVCMIPVIPAFSADADYVVDDGILTDYVGSDTDIVIPSDVRGIADNAFADNTQIKSVKLHNDVYSIGDKAFYGCTSLNTVSGGDSVSYVGALAFADTPYLNDSTEDFLTIGSVLISCNADDASVNLPSEITAISAYAFLRNKTMTSFAAGDNLRIIGEGAFYECSSLSEIDVKSYVSYIGPDAFYGTKWLSSQTGYSVLGDGILVSYKGSDTALAIPQTVRQIAPNAFYNNTTVKSVDIPSSVFSIFERAFMGCSNLQSVTFNDGLVMIGEEAFANCTALNSVRTPASLQIIGKGAFINCSKLNTAYLCGDNLSIEYGAFANCTSLEIAMMSADTSAVREKVFANNPALKAVSVPEQVIMISADTFTGSSDVAVVCEEDSFAHSSLVNSCKVSLSGDVNINGGVEIVDATLIQTHTANINDILTEQLPYADVDFDTNITVLDATRIQRKLAKLI